MLENFTQYFPEEKCVSCGPESMAVYFYGTGCEVHDLKVPCLLVLNLLL